MPSHCWGQLGLAEPLGHIRIGLLNFFVCCTGVSELIPGVRVLQVPPQPRHLCRELEVAVFLCNNLDNMEFGQKVAVSKGEVISIQKLAFGHLLLFSAVCIDLLRQRGSQIVIQLLQSLHQTSFKGSIVLLLGIFDVSRKFGEDINSSSV